ncbi:piggyBac transposable element-derived protein 4-like [Prorops nasuta]|uniref:piggyBac transposable element-derived protein 4-like n=1 Tax=Prorops nasuta TaxID=863751 RepID=UPI0034CFA80A
MEITDIPSDGESIDGLADSDIDENEYNLIDVENEYVEEDESENDLDEDEQEYSGNETWTKKGKERTGGPFTADFGPNIPDNVKSPLEIFSCLVSEDILDIIVQQTNIYIQNNKPNATLITKDELRIFIGINIMMGIKKLPSYRDYWSSDPKLNDSFMQSLMPVVRFGFILGNLHISDNRTEPKKGKPNYDKLYKLRPLLNSLEKNFKTYWKPSKYQSIDESMIKFKGRSSLKQYLPAKPIKRGYKCWIRADESSFVCEFQVYTGKTESCEKQLGARVVKDLTRELVGKNHHVYFDNFFTAVDLLISLKKDNIFACGTVRSNRAGLPKSVISDKEMERGQYDFRTSKTGISWIKWMDKKGVHFLSNYHDPSEVTTVNRRQRDGTLVKVDCPVICSDYNKYMGFVDSADRLISTYKIDRKSKKWWHRIFWYFIDVAVVNSFIIYKKINTDKSVTLKKFRLHLVDGLVSRTVPTKKGRKRQPSIIGSQKPQVSIEKRRFQSAHMPIHIENKRRCTHCSSKTNNTRTHWMCNLCNVPLCLQSDRNCFLIYHS